jgi:hypothetical protein
VCDLRAPRQLARASVGQYSYSEAEYDHHAFLWWAPARLALLPAVQWQPDGAAAAFGGMLAYKVSRAGALSEAARIGAPGFGTTGSSFSRSVVVGSRLLLFSDLDVLTTFVAAPGPGEVTALPQ